VLGVIGARAVLRCAVACCVLLIHSSSAYVWSIILGQLRTAGVECSRCLAVADDVWALVYPSMVLQKLLSTRCSRVSRCRLVG
jgi:hypothetical protein